MTITERLIKRLKWCATRIMMLAAVFLCSACGSVFDDEGDCAPRYYVRFVYDMNMLYADAFATQVSSVDLYVFDAESGAYVTHLSDKGEALGSGSYRMPLTDNVEPGKKYLFIAWCGLADNGEDFTVAQTVAQPGDLTCMMARSRDEKGAYSKRNLKALFHGSLTAELPDKEGEHVYTVKLTKDTNNINLSLQHTAGPLDPNRYEVTMTDDNGLMAHDNSLLADETIEYRPWYQDGGALELGTATSRADAEDGDAEDGGNEGGYLIAELSTARLMANHNARINIVDTQEDKVVFSIPIVQWAVKFRSANHARMGDQEYLDREDEYNLMVVLADDGEGWLAAQIHINGWHLITQDAVAE